MPNTLEMRVIALTAELAALDLLAEREPSLSLCVGLAACHVSSAVDALQRAARPTPTAATLMLVDVESGAGSFPLVAEPAP